MRAVAAILLSVIYLGPLWAEPSKDDVDNRKAQVGGELEKGVVKALFWDELFGVEWDYDISTRFTDSVRLSWPMGENWRNRYRYMIEARPDMWFDDMSRLIGNPPDRLAKYFAGAQFLSESLDARLMYPLIYMVEGKKMQPYIELKHIHIFDTFSNIEVFGRGFADLDEHSFSIGASRKFGSFGAKILWNDFDSFGWSVGYSTVIN